MILRNHGTLAIGASVGEAFLRIYGLERACSAQVRTLAMGCRLNPVTETAAARAIDVGTGMARYSALAWPALLRRVDRMSPGYDSRSEEHTSELHSLMRI